MQTRYDKKKTSKGVGNEVNHEEQQEELADKELEQLVLQAQEEALKEAQEQQEKPRRPFPKWLYWLIAACLIIHAAAFLPEKFSIPAIKFLITSTKLSQQTDIQAYKKAVVAIAAGDSRGTGFSISRDGTIITNYHVIEGNESALIAFPDEGPFLAEVSQAYPEIDLAILKTKEAEQSFPYLTLAHQTKHKPNENVIFIGNPLRFQGIVNEGTLLQPITLKTWHDQVMMLKAPIYRGNSGSPVLNEQGQVIGVIFGTLRHHEHGKVGLVAPIDVYHRYHKES